MSDTMLGLRRKIGSAGDLQSVVRTMKALAAASVGQYEQSVRALGDYTRSVELGLGACLRDGERSARNADTTAAADTGMVGAIVFGSDQGLVGQFNDVIAEFALETLSALPGQSLLWAVGERVHERLADAAPAMAGGLKVPGSVDAIAPLVGQIQIEIERWQAAGDATRVYVFHNRPQAGALYEPFALRLLPLDAQWRRDLVKVRWPTHVLPELMDSGAATLRALIREYLFISLFRACAESLASENASRLAAMERADRNIDELLTDLNGNFHRLRQSSIDAELFDVISGSALQGAR
ncbi:MAG TPA: F0F1 ATP synthase subunit gamma [Rhodocyclaceae bacterium]|jgi:F-type H+-transporting ATPase subunit gamma|nr:F0F1 ATP synthase subunit gamma [Rhodocyclaceae bacterium]